MYLPVIRKAIGVLEEKAFYQIATLYLEGLGYTGLSVVDGPGDGGRDVISDRNDLIIQISVRKDWENKVNDEAAHAKSQGLKHVVYITNRAISQSAEQDFLTSKYKFAGDVDASIHDLNRISTSLSRPGSLSKTHEILHLEIPKEISADPKEVALSSMLLFSS
ncbi:MAG: restriction endonuclease [Oceanospirillaceae bacterium]|uniref:restriction endonuclease n=1 Tax=Salipiger sp. HF18 TaxID=2721557 RepID=UPI00142DA969|nr:restriction endonuclease [Salipiger sp. HF18]NIY98921.1 restriction endonuclease [Salipiger sp. HF18]NVK43854.1 restriction endonuclease [Oceanospirillaceae bacterium]